MLGNLAINYPACACAARGKVINRGVRPGGGGVYKYTLFLEPIFYLSKYSLSEVYFYTDRLLIEFNGLSYTLAARQVFMAIANPDSLRVDNARNTKHCTSSKPEPEAPNHTPLNMPTLLLHAVASHQL